MTARACLRELNLKTTNSTNCLTEYVANCAVFASRARAALLLLLLSLLTACGHGDVVLVTDKPLAPGTVFQDETLLQIGESDGAAPVTMKYLVRAEVRPDGSVRLVYHRDANGSSYGPLSLDGIPLVWRPTPQGSNVTLEQGAPIGAQATDLKKIIPPFLGNSIYPARPVHAGERWDLDANKIRALISQVSGSTGWNQILSDDGALSGWMQLTALADRDGQPCALLNFEVTIKVKFLNTTSILQVTGDAVRSVSSFQDLSMEAKAEWTDPVKPFGSASFHRNVTVPAAQQSAPALADQQHTSSDRQASDDWANRYRNAPWITGAEFLQEVSEVKLEVDASGLGSLVSAEDLEAGIRRALQTEGFQINPQAPVTVHVTVRFKQSDITNHIYGTDVIEQTYHHPELLEFYSMRFLIPATVFREGGFQKLALSPAWSFVTGGFYGGFGRQDVLDDLPSEIHSLLTTIRGDDYRPSSEEETSWSNSLWDERDNERMYKEYAASQNSQGIDLERVFSGVHRLKLSVELEHDSSSCINRSWIENEWGNTLSGAGLPVDPDSPFVLDHQIITLIERNLIGVEVCYTNADVIYFKQRSVVFPWAVKDPGQAQREVRLVRSSVLIDEHVNLGILLPRDRTDVSHQIDQSIQEFIERLRFRR
jgi:hypothetical protein